MQAEKHRRSYIRRKRCLTEITKQIKATLRSISISSGTPIQESQITQNAFAHAKSIEAACWSPRLHISEEEYQQLVFAKTNQVCQALTQEAHMFSDQFLGEPAQFPNATSGSLANTAAAKQTTDIIDPHVPPPEFRSRTIEPTSIPPLIQRTDETKSHLRLPSLGTPIGDRWEGVETSQLSADMANFHGSIYRI